MRSSAHGPWDHVLCARGGLITHSMGLKLFIGGVQLIRNPGEVKDFFIKLLFTSFSNWRKVLVRTDFSRVHPPSTPH